ncbi:MAG: hypothetical protein V1716_01410 [Candidatus Uhrbacteria bacterium]
MRFIKENWFKLSIVAFLFVVAATFVYYFVFFLPTQYRSEVNTTDQTNNDNIILELEYREECMTEFNEITARMDNVIESELSLAITLGKKSGILDENGFFNDKDIWIRNCINEKFTK